METAGHGFLRLLYKNIVRDAVSRLSRMWNGDAGAGVVDKRALLVLYCEARQYNECLSRSWLSKAGAGRARAGQGRAWQGMAGQGRAGEGRAGQGRAGHGTGPVVRD